MRTADAGAIGARAGKVVNRYKVAKHFDLQIADGAFSYTRKHEQITAEAALDGVYVIRTTCPDTKLTSPGAVVRVYKQLKMAERAFRTMKTTIEIRPIYHHLEDRVRAHAFLCMLAYHVAFELQRRLAPLLFTDTQPHVPTDPVAPAQSSRSAIAKAASARTADGHTAHDFEDLIADLGTLCKNEIRLAASQHTITRLTTPTELQHRRSSRRLRERSPRPPDDTADPTTTWHARPAPAPRPKLPAHRHHRTPRRETGLTRREHRLTRRANHPHSHQITLS